MSLDHLEPLNDIGYGRVDDVVITPTAHTAGAWSLKLLPQYLLRTYQVTLSVDQVQRIMHQLGFRRVRARRKLAKGAA